ncbi:MAG: AAA family ATPase, partial [Alphaproteobacteria bacterium]
MYLDEIPDYEKDSKRKAAIPLQVLSMGDLHRREIDERPKLLPWLPQGGLVMIVAAPGVGKTIFTMGVASTISRGGSFLKWYNPEPYEVLYIDGEMSLKEITKCPQCFNLYDEPRLLPCKFIKL